MAYATRIRMNESENLGNFEIHKILGCGGFGVVLKVRRIKNWRKYALKLNRNTDSHTANEVRHFAKIPIHKNVVTYYSYWTDNISRKEMKSLGISNFVAFRIPRGINQLQILCIQVELCGQDLRYWLRQRWKHVKVEKCRCIFQQLLNGLQHIHNQGLIHRDLKPDNILFALDDPNLVKIGDFGISAVHEGTTNDLHTRAFGSRLYMAPEQYTNSYGKQVDLFALGFILFEIYHPPAQADLEHSLTQLRNFKTLPEEFKTCWPEVSKAILSLLEYNPKKRPNINELTKMLSGKTMGRRCSSDGLLNVSNDHLSNDALPITVVVCDGCGARPIKGFRYKCKSCDNFDYCSVCYWSAVSHRSRHEFITISKPRVEILPPCSGDIIVHHEVECDGCQENPIKGKRYNCQSCTNLDFCRNCYVAEACHRERHNFTLITECQWHHHACKGVENRPVACVT